MNNIDYARELKNGKFIRVSGEGYEPVVFWLSNWGETVNFYGREIGGAFEHPRPLDEIVAHIENMQQDGFTITVFDITKVGG